MRLALISAAGFAAAFASSGAAQSPADSARFVPPADTTIGVAPTLKPVQVKGKKSTRTAYLPALSATATRIPLLPRDVPQAMTLVTRALIADQGMQGMADVVRYVPGVTMGQGEGNRDQPTIRGNATTADFFVNGVRDDAQYFRDLYDVERVEAVKGPNAMIFGRGGGGGVINRISKEAGDEGVREVSLQGGSYSNRRITADLSPHSSGILSSRVNAVHERSGLFRDGVTLERTGVHPVVTITSTTRATRLTGGFEYFRDHRTADRGIPSFEGRPVETDPSTFFGDATQSHSDSRVRAAEATVSHQSGGLSVRSHTRIAAHDKNYQNVFPGAVTADGAQVSISAYGSSVVRRNLFSQLDLTYRAVMGSVSHALLVGAETGRQASDVFRRTGYFNTSSTSVLVPVGQPRAVAPLSFRQSATDPDTRVVARVGSLYAQDVIGFGESVQLIAGIRQENFDLGFRDKRSGSSLAKVDRMISPRIGLVLKPAALASIYASYSVSHLPGSGDQFSALTNLTAALEPESFRNFEAGAKWDIADRLALTAALYRLDRTNTRAPAANDPTQFVQTGAQRSTGYELGVSGALTGRWQMVGGYANQRAVISSTTADAIAGAFAPLVPRKTFSLWNRYAVSPALGLGAGVVQQSKMFASINNAVTLPAFSRFDLAAYLAMGRALRAQVNLENVLGARYFITAHSNNNISPGSPRSVRASLTTSF